MDRQEIPSEKPSSGPLCLQSESLRLRAFLRLGDILAEIAHGVSYETPEVLTNDKPLSAEENSGRLPGVREEGYSRHESRYRNQCEDSLKRYES